MKNRLIAILLLFILTIAQLSAFATVPDSITPYETQDISCYLNCEKVLNTVTPDDASFTVEYYIKSGRSAVYSVEASIDGTVKKTWQTKVEPYKKLKESYSLPRLDIGNYKLNVKVSKDGATVKSFDIRLPVLEAYEEQFMGEYTPVGFCTHFSHFNFEDPKHEESLATMDIMDYAGVIRSRGGVMHHRDNVKEGDFNFFGGGSKWWKDGDSWDNWWLEEAKKREHLEFYHCVSAPLGGNPNSDLPDDVELTSREIRTTKSMQIYADTIIEVLTQLGWTKGVELYNEPNIQNFWTSQEDSAIDYSNLLKETVVQIREKFPDTRTDGYCVTDFSLKWLEDCFKYGSYPYSDSVSYHPYVYMYEVEDANDQLNRRMYTLYDFLESYGGWKDIVITEIGQPTYNGNDLYNRKDVAAERMVKQIFITDSYDVGSIDLYQLNDRANSAERSLDDREHNFGLVEREPDGTRYPKESFMSVVAYNKELAGAIALGRLNLGDGFYGYAYAKDGKAKLAVWYYDGKRGSKTLDLGDEKATIKDMYGNVTAKGVNTVEIGMAPQYICDISIEWLRRGALDEVTNKNALWLKNYKEIAPDDLYAKAERLFDDSEEKFGSVISAEEAKSIVDAYFKLGYDVLSLGKSGKISAKDTSSMLYGLYACADAANNYFVATYSGENTTPTFDLKKAETLADKSYENKKQIMPFSYGIHYTIKKFAKRADEVSKIKKSNPMKAGVITGYSNMAENLYGWMKEFTSFEKAEEYALTIRVPGYDTFCFVGETKNVRVVLNNQSAKDFTGRLKVYDENGGLVGETARFTLKKDTKRNSPISFKIAEPNKGKTAYYTFKLENDHGEAVQSQAMLFTTRETATMSVLPISEELENVKSVRLKVTNNRDNAINLNTSFTSSENITLGINKMDISLEKGETRIIDAPVVSVKDTEFHCYTLGYEAKNENDEVVASAKQLLSFTSVVKSKEKYSAADFNGDISSWADAYPIYIGQPNMANNPDNWYGANRQARVLSKWDEDNLYMYVEVYDDIQNQQYTGETMWQGDSIQIAIDSSNTKSGGYDSDDYELGFALGSSGFDTHSWQGKISETTPGNWVNIIRDDEKQVTKYFIVMNKSNITGLNLSEGAAFGYNIVCNDADVLTREGFVQFTLGTGDAKNTSLLETFTLRPVRSGKPDADKNIIFK